MCSWWRGVASHAYPIALRKSSTASTIATSADSASLGFIPITELNPRGDVRLGCDDANMCGVVSSASCNVRLPGNRMAKSERECCCSTRQYQGRPDTQSVWVMSESRHHLRSVSDLYAADEIEVLLLEEIRDLEPPPSAYSRPEDIQDFEIGTTLDRSQSKCPYNHCWVLFFALCTFLQICWNNRTFGSTQTVLDDLCDLLL